MRSGRAWFAAAVVLWTRVAWGACPDDPYEACGAACLRACDVTYEKVQATVEAASPGDTVEVPAGTATWSDGLAISRGIELLGAGAGSTVVSGAIEDPIGCRVRVWRTTFVVGFRPPTGASGTMSRLKVAIRS